MRKSKPPNRRSNLPPSNPGEEIISTDLAVNRVHAEERSAVDEGLSMAASSARQPQNGNFVAYHTTTHPKIRTNPPKMRREMEATGGFFRCPSPARLGRQRNIRRFFCGLRGSSPTGQRRDRIEDTLFDPMPDLNRNRARRLSTCRRAALSIDHRQRDPQWLSRAGEIRNGGVLDVSHVRREVIAIPIGRTTERTTSGARP
jgi:hypothetical protein